MPVSKVPTWTSLVTQFKESACQCRRHGFDPSSRKMQLNCWGATKPMRHNYWACALKPGSRKYWALAPQLLKPEQLQPMLCHRRSHRNEKPRTPQLESSRPVAATRESQGSNQDPARPKNKQTNCSRDSLPHRAHGCLHKSPSSVCMWQGPWCWGIGGYGHQISHLHEAFPDHLVYYCNLLSLNFPTTLLPLLFIFLTFYIFYLKLFEFIKLCHLLFIVFIQYCMSLC